jgi:hypothetical protein
MQTSVPTQALLAPRGGRTGWPRRPVRYAVWQGGRIRALLPDRDNKLPGTPRRQRPTLALGSKAAAHVRVTDNIRGAGTAGCRSRDPSCDGTRSVHHFAACDCQAVGTEGRCPARLCPACGTACGAETSPRPWRAGVRWRCPVCPARFSVSHRYPIRTHAIDVLRGPSRVSGPAHSVQAERVERLRLSVQTVPLRPRSDHRHLR